MTDFERLTAEHDAAIADATALYAALEDLLAQAEHYNDSWSVPQFLSDEPAVATARLALLAHNGAQPSIAHEPLLAQCWVDESDCSETTEQMVERMR
jgi:hypothetical protein